MDVTINAALRELPLTLGLVKARVTVTEHDEALWREIDARIAEINGTLTLESLLGMPPIRAQRETYRRLGKAPSRYRGSAEALARRVLQGKGLYRVNTVVDINNLVSLRSLHPVASYDLDRLSGDIVLRVGQEGESYTGIGKGPLNLAQMPVFCDEEGPFGSATSDSEQAMIGSETRHIVMVILAFSGPERLEADIELACSLLRRHVQATELETLTVS
jgi:DNA/RNA-binding domain of Phe-tRNA-synthetase-like protein